MGIKTPRCDVCGEKAVGVQRKPLYHGAKSAGHVVGLMKRMVCPACLDLFKTHNEPISHYPEEQGGDAVYDTNDFVWFWRLRRRMISSSLSVVGKKVVNQFYGMDSVFRFFGKADYVMAFIDWMEFTEKERKRK